VYVVNICILLIVMNIQKLIYIYIYIYIHTYICIYIYIYIYIYMHVVPFRGFSLLSPPISVFSYSLLFSKYAHVNFFVVLYT
jgi:hypothetical protein